MVFCENHCCLLVEFVCSCTIFTLSNISEQISCIKLHFGLLACTSDCRTYDCGVFHPLCRPTDLCYVVCSTRTGYWTNNMSITAGNALRFIFPMSPPYSTQPFHLLKGEYQIDDIHVYFAIEQKSRIDCLRNVLRR